MLLDGLMIFDMNVFMVYNLTANAQTYLQLSELAIIILFNPEYALENLLRSVITSP